MTQTFIVVILEEAYHCERGIIKNITGPILIETSQIPSIFADYIIPVSDITNKPFSISFSENEDSTMITAKFIHWIGTQLDAYYKYRVSEPIAIRPTGPVLCAGTLKIMFETHHKTQPPYNRIPYDWNWCI